MGQKSRGEKEGKGRKKKGKGRAPDLCGLTAAGRAQGKGQGRVARPVGGEGGISNFFRKKNCDYIPLPRFTSKVS